LRLNRLVFGDSLFAIRLIPSAAHAATVVLAGVITRHLGGQKFAQMLAAVVMAFAPGIVGITGIYSMNAIEILLWSLVFYFFIRVIETKRHTYWIIIGILLGLGMMNKISMGWMAAGLSIGVLATPLRQQLRTRWPWYAALIAAVLFLPFVIWNMTHDFAHVEFAANAARFKYASQNPATFFTGLFMLYNPLAIPVWAAGFFTLLRHPEKSLRSIGYVVLTVLVILLVNYNSKSEYFNPAAVVLFAAGAVKFEQWFSMRWRFAGYLYCFIIGATGVLIMPMAIDVLSPLQLSSYMERIGVPKQNSEGHRMGALPQHFADRFGWKEMAANVSEVFHSLDQDEKSITMIYAQNYGEASAIDFYGKQYGLPNVMCGHNSYWTWGNDRLDDSAGVLIAIGGSVDDYSDLFSEIRMVKKHSAEYAMPYENDLPIFVCRKPRARLRDMWHSAKHYM
jgi:hypothetical protein